MRVLIRMPNWLGDAVMATPAVENLRRHYPSADLILVAPAPVAALFAPDSAFAAVCADRTKQARFRLSALRRLGRSLSRRYGPFDLAVALPNSLSSRWLLWTAGAKRRGGAKTGWHDLLLTDAVPVDREAHQAEIYNQIICGLTGREMPAGPTRLFVSQRHCYPRPAAGINPGAAYGSAKRWLPERFADVAAELAGDYGIVVFGSDRETDMAAQIESALRRRGIGCDNVAGRTTVGELAARLAGLSLLVTNDSGPMHIAGAFGVPTVSIFGSTNHRQTYPWGNDQLRIVRRDLPCAPCMRRTCPLGHHACMNEIQPAEVLQAARELA